MTISDTSDSSNLSALHDVVQIHALLLARARVGEDISYARLLAALGLRFTRPRMRALCRTLGAVDRLCLERGEPNLAVLVVRESDRLPGQGWWVGSTAQTLGYDGPWQGSEATRFIRAQQQQLFDYWSTS